MSNLDRSAPRPCQGPDCAKTFTPRPSGPIGRTCSDACRKRVERAEAAGRRSERRAGAASLADVMGHLYGEPDAPQPDDWTPLTGVLADWAPGLLADFRALAEEADAVRNGPAGLVELIEEWPLGVTPGRRGVRRSPIERAISQLPGGALYGAGFGVEGDAPGVFDPRRLTRRDEGETSPDLGPALGDRAGASEFVYR
ncbi:hypothetical protein ABZ949_07295 [Micromonospora tulbaghiae]|uniref:hypothetical protein n=1 Tax=Micromonospora tulbaghiae TaxID=479978 RepID=UPI0033E1194B